MLRRIIFIGAGRNWYGAAIALICFTVWSCSGAAAYAVDRTGSEQAPPTLNEIENTYRYGDREKGIDLLTAAILSGMCYKSEALRDTVLQTLRDYFLRVEDRKAFTDAIYQITKCGDSQAVRDKFHGTRLNPQALEAIAEYETPTKITMTLDSHEAKVGTKVSFELRITNARGDPLSPRGVQLRCEVRPDNCGICNIAGGYFEAAAPGNAKLKVWPALSPDTYVEESIDIPYPEAAPKPEIAKIVPEESRVLSTIRIFGKHFDPLKGNNTIVFIGPKVTADSVVLDPEGLDILWVTVPKGAISGPVIVRTPDGETAPVDFTVGGPSKKWAWVGTGATAVSGAVFFNFMTKAQDKSDECDGLDANAPTYASDHKKCVDEYDDLAKWEKVAGGLTAATGLISGYLWYKYFKNKGLHQKIPEPKSGAIGLRFDPVRSRVMLTYWF